MLKIIQKKKASPFKEADPKPAVKEAEKPSVKPVAPKEELGPPAVSVEIDSSKDISDEPEPLTAKLMHSSDFCPECAAKLGPKSFIVVSGDFEASDPDASSESEEV
jgi:hypothetical protein